MSDSVQTLPVPPETSASKSAIRLVLLCTCIGAAAQILMKIGGNGIASYTVAQLLAQPLLILKNLPLFAGYALYGISTILMIFALRRGELSILYPIISLTYVWVLVLSAVIFHERLNSWKILGVMAIVTGVGILGRNNRS